MKQILLYLSFCLFAFSTSSAQKKITLEDIFNKNTFSVKSAESINMMQDEQSISNIAAIQKDDAIFYTINIYNLSDGAKKLQILNTADLVLDNMQPLKNQAISKYAFSQDESKVILLFQKESIYRRSAKYLVYVYDIKHKKFQIIDNEKILHPSFNPQGNKVAYVKDNNIFVYDLTNNQKTQITFDGKNNEIINGNCDWVYEEEFGFTQAYQWSPDGQYIAYYRFDERQVPEYTMVKFDSIYPTQYTYKYPKAGEDNSKVSIHVYQLNSTSTLKADLGENTDIYIPRIKWANNEELCILKLNRLQNELKYLMYHTKHKSTKSFLTIEDPYYVDVDDDFVFYDNGRKMIFTWERDGWRQIYSVDRSQQSRVQKVTKSENDVISIVGFDAKSNNIYYLAYDNNPLQSKLYSINTSGSSQTILSKEKGWHEVIAMSSMKYFLLKYSALDQVPIYTLIDRRGNKIITIEDNKPLAQNMKSFNWGKVHFFKTKAADKTTDLNGWIIVPPHLDSNKKYPVLMYQYSGPGSQEVLDKFPLGHYFWHQYLAQEGYVIVCVDGRGTGGRGREFKKMTYLQLGKYESDDQIAVAKQLGQQFKFIDKQRIGIWGWSYGGFMSATCILKGNDVFKTAVSVAPVTHWKYYDNIYTERYMRRPIDNPQGYDNNAPEMMADRLTGNLLIIHGTSDDNVHFQNAVMLTQALINENKQFESIYYPNRDHGIRGGNTRYQLFNKITQYIFTNL